jgi:HAD superfamily hydrolase (TIGR01549 family)
MVKNILFDFDGVILDSMPVREYGFRKIFEDYDDDLVNKLLKFHNANGGLSRYIKIEYFYNELLGQDISNKNVKKLAENFSVIMRKRLTDKKYLIEKTMNFIYVNFKSYNLHIVSGSDEKELQFLCKKLEIGNYFISIHGSPTHKNYLVSDILNKNSYKANETILIGDSINDHEAAEVNNIDFYGFNNVELRVHSKVYIEDYNCLK